MMGDITPFKVPEVKHPSQCLVRSKTFRTARLVYISLVSSIAVVLVFHNRCWQLLCLAGQGALTKTFNDILRIFDSVPILTLDARMH